MNFSINGIYLFSKTEHKIVKFRQETQDFNYVTIRYSSDLYIKAVAVVLLSDGSFTNRTFLIEPDGTYACFYLPVKEQASVMFVGLDLFNLENKTGRAEIRDIDVCKKETFCGATLKNDELFAGFSADKGGVLSFLTSCKYRIGEYTAQQSARIRFDKERVADPCANANLINCYDNGRYPQQIFLGTGNPPYQASVYRDTVWRFNPVQSGDSHGNTSEVIDFSVTENEVKIRVAPLDWAKNASSPDCYMESVYRLDKNAIIVNNRFVDYSMLNRGMNATPANQQLPAFGIIPSLYRYCVPLSDGTVKEVDSLKFWGNAESAFHQLFVVKKGWSCWLNEDNFGLGLYTAETNNHLAGKSITSGGNTVPACYAESVNYIAGIKKFTLLSLCPVEYSYAIAFGSLEEITETLGRLSEAEERRKAKNG